MTTVPCIACHKQLENPFGPYNQPDGGTAFASGGHYGSTVFDPMDGTQLEINVCDECMTGAALAGRVLHHHYGSREPELWRGPAQRIEARSDETPKAVQPEGREPGPKDAPKGVGHAQ